MHPVPFHMDSRVYPSALKVWLLCRSAMHSSPSVPDYFHTWISSYPVDSRGNEYRPEEFPKPTVSYVVEHGSQEPGPDPNPTPNPGNNGGGSHGGHGGGSSSGSKKSSTTTASGPAAQPTELVTPVVPEPQPVVPAEGLPKTGDTDRMDVPMALLAIGMMAAAYVLMTGRKKTEE